ncbi:hypothetical protein PR048_005708 [Dryococelus australis]|uniref:HAT C-terminal dimerisation domain-containing protein n=1 Tax=Dryococelus australis TaxID=614101 RepID=A0ABQ9IA58_9NEOP|nr:hypothetical protein PR048_005708 [Dryococelus australis]
MFHWNTAVQLKDDAKLIRHEKEKEISILSTDTDEHLASNSCHTSRSSVPIFQQQQTGPIQRHFNCTVRSFIADNAANAAKMREELARKDIKDVITYELTKQLVKYFGNTHYAAAKYRQAGGTTLTLSTDVRWNYLADCIESYLNDWHIIAKINCTVMNVPLVKQLKFGLIYIIFFKNENDCDFDELNYFMKRFNIAMTEAYLLANLMDPCFRGERLTEEQNDSAMDPATLKEVTRLVWWVALERSTHHASLNLAHQLHSAVVSSAGIERLFSTFRYVHSSVRDREGCLTCNCLLCTKQQKH